MVNNREGSMGEVTIYLYNNADNINIHKICSNLYTLNHTIHSQFSKSVAIKEIIIYKDHFLTNEEILKL